MLMDEVRAARQRLLMRLTRPVDLLLMGGCWRPTIRRYNPITK